MSKSQILMHKYFDAAWQQGRKGKEFVDTTLPEHAALINYIAELEKENAELAQMHLNQGLTIRDKDRRIAKLEQKLATAEAKIDALMLEYCPEEMTKEQIEEWEKNQKVSDFKLQCQECGQPMSISVAHDCPALVEMYKRQSERAVITDEYDDFDRLAHAIEKANAGGKNE